MTGLRDMASLQHWLGFYHAEESDLELVNEADVTYGLIIPKAQGTVVILSGSIQFYPGNEWESGELPQREVRYELMGPTGYADVAYWLRTIDYVFAEDQVEDFTTQYVETLLWSETDATSEEDNPEPLDTLGYDIGDLSAELRAEVIAECANFLNFHGHEVRAAMLLDDALGGSGSYGITNAAHDFALTRNHHGAGFWDRGLRMIGDRLTEAAQLYGQTSWYIGDDGKVHSC